jgi:hypothetical protein
MLHFWICARDPIGVGSKRTCTFFKEQGEAGLRNPEGRRTVSNTESWKSRDSSSSGVPESRNAKHRNPESRRTVLDTGSWKSRDSSSSGVPESRNVKPRKPETGTSTGGSNIGSWKSQESRLFNTGVPKCRNAKRRKSRNRHINRSFGYQELEESRVKTLHHRSPEVAKCETPKHLFV